MADPGKRQTFRQATAFATAVMILVASGFSSRAAAVFQSVAVYVSGLFLFRPESLQAITQCTRSTIDLTLLLLIVTFWERKTLRSAGLARIRVEDLFAGTSAWLMYSLLFPIIVRLSHLGPTYGRVVSGGDPFVVPDRWQYTMFFLDILLEEFASRGYLIERIISFSGSGKLAAGCSLAFSVAMHIPGRGFTLALNRAPLIMLLTVLYMLQRSVVPCLVKHALTDMGMPFIAFHAVALLPWVFLPQLVWLPLLLCSIAYLLFRKNRDHGEVARAATSNAHSGRVDNQTSRITSSF